MTIYWVIVFSRLTKTQSHTHAYVHSLIHSSSVPDGLDVHQPSCEEHSGEYEEPFVEVVFLKSSRGQRSKFSVAIRL